VRVWIDLANSPHPVLFAPIADALERDGHEIVATVRDHAQTLALTRERWPDATVVGVPSPPSRAGKALSIARRARELAAFARRVRPDVAVSHNSYAQSVAARIVRVPCVTAMDYEFQPANHVAFRFANRVVVPRDYPARELRRQGARDRGVWRYEGFKEEVYLHGFEPDAAALAAVGLAPGDPFVVARPSPAGASYHQFGNPLFERAVRELLEHSEVRVVLLGRRPSDADGYPAALRERLIAPEQAVEARSLIFHARAVVGAGGTMNREAALLGTPVFSLYAGKLGALDRRLIAEGSVRHLAGDDADLSDLLAAAAGSGSRTSRPPLTDAVLRRFVEAIVSPLR
jgi:predicted glycosyltransferase